MSASGNHGRTSNSATRGEVVGHEIVKCSCGAIIRRCRCMGPHPVRVIDRSCVACKAAPAPAALSAEIDLSSLVIHAEEGR